jgi:hypothetical protein
MRWSGSRGRWRRDSGFDDRFEFDVHDLGFQHIVDFDYRDIHHGNVNYWNLNHNDH